MDNSYSLCPPSRHSLERYALVVFDEDSNKTSKKLLNLYWEHKKLQQIWQQDHKKSLTTTVFLWFHLYEPCEPCSEPRDTTIMEFNKIGLFGKDFYQRLWLLSGRKASNIRQWAIKSKKSGKIFQFYIVFTILVLPKLPKRPTEELVQTHENSCHSASKFGR